MALALITGLHPDLEPAASGLARAGFTVTTWAWPAGPPPAGGPFDCYMQLPCGRAEARQPETGRRRNRPAPGAGELLSRVDTLAAVAAYLRPSASVLLGVEEADPATGPQPGTLAPDLLEAVALALLEDLGRPTARVIVLSVGDLCRPEAAFAPIDPLVRAAQWEMPTPPLVSAP